MKRRPSSSFLVCVAVAVILGGIGFWFLWKLKEFPVNQWRHLSFSQILHGKTEYTSEEQAAARKRAEELRQELLATYPTLAPQEHPVPDERNGFRLLIELADDMDKGKTPMTFALGERVKSNFPWDPVAMRAALAENGELIARIESIAALPERSSVGLPERFDISISSGEVKACGDILMAKARLAAEAKDEAEALRLTTAALNLASHLDQVERPTFLNALIGMLTDQNVNRAVITDLLPALGQDADLSKWRTALTFRPTYSADHCAHIVRGEWNVTFSHFYLPMLLAPGANGNPKDGEAFAHAHAEQFDFIIRSLKGRKPTVLLAIPTPPAPKAKLSRESRNLLDVSFDAFTTWIRGYARAASVRAMTLAALDLLAMEKSGTTLTKDSISKVTPEPLTGQTFLYDPATRTLTTPTTFPGDTKVKPLKLPW